MIRFAHIAPLIGTLALGACAVVPPSGPSLPAMPPQGKNLAAFQQDDIACRQYAEQQTGGVTPAAAAQQSTAGSAVLGTVLGAATGAAIGAAVGNPAAGAAIGAGSGLVLGTAAGADAGQYSAAQLQQRYDIGYAQCMASKGNSVPVMAAAAAAPPPYAAYPGYAYGPYPYPYPYYAYGYPAVYGPAFVSVGGGWGGHGGGHGGWRR